jgi:hypothetical protein
MSNDHILTTYCTSYEYQVRLSLAIARDCIMVALQHKRVKYLFVYIYVYYWEQ